MAKPTFNTFSITLAVACTLLCTGALAKPAPTAQAKPAESQQAAPTQIAGQATLVVRPGEDAGLVATRHWAQTAKGLVVMDGDTPLFPFGLARATLACSPGFLCTVALQDGEVPLSVSVGSPGEWSFEVNPGANKYLVAVRALVYTGQSNLVIQTDKRTYSISLVADRTQYVPQIGFYYPKDTVSSWINKQALATGGQVVAQAAPVQATPAAVQTQAIQKAAPGTGKASEGKAGGAVVGKSDDPELPSLTAADLDFRYYLDGLDYSWKPIRVFDDGKKMYLEMNPKMQPSNAPVLVGIASDGSQQVVNYRVVGNTFISDQILDKALLLNGVGRGAEKVEIFKGDKPKKMFGFW